MDDATAKVIAETWALSCESEVDRSSRVLLTLAFVDDLCQEPGELARMQIAACAPEALRLLMAAEWGGRGRRASWGQAALPMVRGVEAYRSRRRLRVARADAKGRHPLT